MYKSNTGNKNYHQNGGNLEMEVLRLIKKKKKFESTFTIRSLNESKTPENSTPLSLSCARCYTAHPSPPLLSPSCTNSLTCQQIREGVLSAQYAPWHRLGLEMAFFSLSAMSVSATSAKVD